MRWIVDLAYALAAIVSSPFWLTRMARTGKLRTDWKGRLGRTAPLPAADRPRVLIHAVSVGEVNAIRQLVEQLAAKPSKSSGGFEIVIATTTDTGFARAQKLWGGQHAVVRYPLDFSWSVNRFLNAIKPTVAVLVELEVWPNFTSACERSRIPVMIVNGRLTKRSFNRYRLIGPLVKPAFKRVRCAAVQNHAYAERFKQLGVRADAIHITGTMKWDTAVIADEVAGASELAAELGIDRTRPLIVAGSTAPDEHRLLLAAKPPNVQLLCAPRKPEWFDQAAADLPGCVRRSRKAAQSRSSRAGSRDLFLLDTIGELRQAYALADLVIIGRSFGKLHGSDMMEPVALGKPVIVGPAVADFQDTVDALLAGDGIVQTSAPNLRVLIYQLLHDPERRASLAQNGREVIRKHQGATARNAELLRSLLPAAEGSQSAFVASPQVV